MPTILTHAVAAAAIGTVVLPRRTPPSVWFAGIACAMVPDVDVISFAFGVDYGDLLGHRGFTHSLLFAAIAAMAVSLIRFRRAEAIGRWRIALFICIATASHGVLDAFTDGGLGIAFFAPFDATRYFFPVTPIRVSPIGAAFFSSRGGATLQSELVWVWLRAIAFAIAALRLRRQRIPA